MSAKPESHRRALLPDTPQYGLLWKLQQALDEARGLIAEGCALNEVHTLKYRTFRKAAGLNVPAFVALTGLSSGTIQNVEEGYSSRLETVEIYLKALVEVVEGQHVIPGRRADWIEVPFGSWVAGKLSPSALLNPEMQVVDFHGVDRKLQLSRLVTGCFDEEKLGIQSFTAEAGMGKTRLGVELCEAVLKEEHRRKAEDWAVGFLVPERFPETGAPWTGLDLAGKSMLLVVDYAGGYRELPVLRRLLTHVLEHPLRRLRILLLDRHDYWLGELKTDKACGEIIQRPNFRRNFADSALASAVDGDNREAVFTKAAVAFRTLLKSKQEIARVQGLENPIFNRLLMIHMLAFLSVDRQEGESLKAKDILEAVLNRERRQWERGLRVREMDLLLRPVLERVFWTISREGGAKTQKDALKQVKTVRGFGKLDEHVQDAVLEILHGCYASARAYIEPLRPDYLGEFFLARRPADPRAK